MYKKKISKVWILAFCSAFMLLSNPELSCAEKKALVFDSVLFMKVPVVGLFSFTPIFGLPSIPKGSGINKLNKFGTVRGTMKALAVSVGIKISK